MKFLKIIWRDMKKTIAKEKLVFIITVAIITLTTSAIFSEKAAVLLALVYTIFLIVVVAGLLCALGIVIHKYVKEVLREVEEDVR